ncbi:AAA family ATPase [Mechercharimyces sp. CAU 1602]|uniref:AAA family ATPase n=1 Tax=Mechercharimyces sp. CAU 1602 TaxID=2973933 RepID=UPI002161FB2A|nr:AAA family ATPase [Mechercharimyces sp. CAU 1602]MCS1350369.1 AAA family ATPase [Mechercharimyces sp. CAU 1602]
MKIALTGKMRSGKSTVAEYLSENYGFHSCAFGDTLKLFANKLFQPRQLKDRQLYQWFGQTMRERESDIWVRHLDYAIYDLVTTGKNIVITDLRQPNEYQYCREKGFAIIRVTCPDDIRLQRMRQEGDLFDETTLNHETEMYIDGFGVDFEIENGGRWLDMAEQVDVIVRNLPLIEEAM